MSSVSKLKFSAASCSHHDFAQALDRATGELVDALDAPADLVFAFVSAHYISQIDEHFERIASTLSTESVLGCTAESLISGRTEIEFEPAVSLWAASLPGVEIIPFHLHFDRHADGGAFFGWPDSLIGGWPDGSFMLTLADPFSFPADVLLERSNNDRPDVQIVGGMASGGAQPGDCQLILGDKIYDQGCVAVRLSGDVNLRTVVSQGCRPVGEPLVITKCERNVIHELRGEPALERLKKIFVTLPTREQKLMQNGLHVGRVVDEYAENISAGDFLIRNVVGFEEETGGVVIADFVRPGQTIQFHIRDADSAHVDLQNLLSQQSGSKNDILGALSFSCNGRGSRLFEVPHHDASLIQDFLGPIPLAGFFAAGEIGPIGKRNFMHGFTNSIALFEQA